MTERQVRAIVRQEIAAALRGEGFALRHVKCGRGHQAPMCEGSAALGPSGCTCPPVLMRVKRKLRR